MRSLDLATVNVLIGFVFGICCEIEVSESGRWA